MDEEETALRFAPPGNTVPPREPVPEFIGGFEAGEFFTAPKEAGRERGGGFSPGDFMAPESFIPPEEIDRGSIGGDGSGFVFSIPRETPEIAKAEPAQGRSITAELSPGFENDVRKAIEKSMLRQKASAAGRLWSKRPRDPDEPASAGDAEFKAPSQSGADPRSIMFDAGAKNIEKELDKTQSGPQAGRILRKVAKDDQSNAA
ncbi:MAG: hypothetical protein LBT92_04170 [Rickettsiales bacterium]|jgi:hypothetical protein|nr:hypothetical protein [Rickettsiales bacterium]